MCHFLRITWDMESIIVIPIEYTFLCMLFLRSLSYCKLENDNRTDDRWIFGQMDINPDKLTAARKIYITDD